MGRTIKKITARMTKSMSDRHRVSIQTTKLVKRLQDASDGKVDLTPVALKATQILLDKTLPNLQAIEMTNEPPPERSREEVEGFVQQALLETLKAIPPEERQALIDSIGKRELLGRDVIDLNPEERVEQG
jgi:hypothetical protein